ARLTSEEPSALPGQLRSVLVARNYTTSRQAMPVFFRRSRFYKWRSEYLLMPLHNRRGMKLSTGIRYHTVVLIPASALMLANTQPRLARLETKRRESNEIKINENKPCDAALSGVDLRRRR